MQVKVPKGRAYYYECTGRRIRLLYCIPETELKALVKRGKAKKQILRDYPDGLDLKVSPLYFDEFRSNYGLELDIDPDDIRRAFDAVWLKTNRSVRGSGYIDAAFLEKLATRLRKALAKSGPALPRARARPATLKDRKKASTLSARLSRNMEAFLRGFPVPRLKKKAPLVEQPFAEVEMTDGEEPSEVFAQLRKRARGES